MKNNLSKLASPALLLVAVIWGSGFIATEYAIRAQMSAAFIMAIRFCIAALVMLPFCRSRFHLLNRQGLFCGVIAGVLLFLAFYTQTVGQSHTSVSNSAFLTATNVVMVPFIVWAISKKPPPLQTFLLAVTTLVGIGFLTIQPSIGLRLSKGDLLVLLCAFLFAIHITYLGLFGKRLEARLLTFMQLAVAGLISLVVLLFSGDFAAQLPTLRSGLPSVLYLALFSTCVCYYLQTWAQQHTTPSKAGIILCCEGLFGSLLSVLLGLEALRTELVIGGIIILSSIVLAELDFSKLSQGFRARQKSE